MNGELMLFIPIQRSKAADLVQVSAERVVSRNLRGVGLRNLNILYRIVQGGMLIRSVFLWFCHTGHYNLCIGNKQKRIGIWRPARKQLDLPKELSDLVKLNLKRRIYAVS